MTLTQTPKPLIYIDLNINNNIFKTFSFTSEQQAYTFFLTSLKQVTFTFTDDKTALISAVLYKHSKKSKHILMKKNLTKVFYEKNT